MSDTQAPAELLVPADPAYLDLVGQFISGMARRCGFTERVVARVRLAIDEACANALLHGRLAAEDRLRISCWLSDRGMSVAVEDRGPVFDLESLPQPELGAPLEKRRIGGLGVYLMRRVMDSVVVEPRECGKAVVLAKHLSAEEASDGGH